MDLAIPTLGVDGVLLYRNLEVVIPQCPQDLTGDGAVGSADLSALLAAWGACP